MLSTLPVSIELAPTNNGLMNTQTFVGADKCDNDGVPQNDRLFPTQDRKCASTNDDAPTSLIPTFCTKTATECRFKHDSPTKSVAHENQQPDAKMFLAVDNKSNYIPHHQHSEQTINLSSSSKARTSKKHQQPSKGMGTKQNKTANVQYGPNIFELLSCDLQMHMLTFLDIRDLYHISLSCKEGAHLVLSPEADEYVWKLVATRYGYNKEKRDRIVGNSPNMWRSLVAVRILAVIQINEIINSTNSNCPFFFEEFSDDVNQRSNFLPQINLGMRLCNLLRRAIPCFTCTQDIT